MIYGNPIREHMERIKNSIQLKEWISAGYFLPLLQMTPPCEMTTQQELLYLVERSKTVTPERLAVIQEYNSMMHVSWAKYLNSLGIMITAAEVKSIMDKYEVIVDYLKVKFNRPRPFQAAGYYNIPLYPWLPADSGDSAYPSGHTFLSLCIYHHMVIQHPELNKDLMLMVLKMKQSREDGGVHYPSDGLFSFQVYHHLKDHLFPKGSSHPHPDLDYLHSADIPDLVRVTDVVADKRELGRGPGAVAQAETKHLPTA